MDGALSQCVFHSRPVTPCSQLRAAEVEIKDLQSEFELEKIDYLATIRRQERDFLLFQQLLEQVQPLIRRDCNYSNLEKIRREACWDEDSGFWKIPEPVIVKTSLPVGQQPGWALGPPSPPSPSATLQTDGELWASPRWLWVKRTGDPEIPKRGDLRERCVLSQADVGWNCGSAPPCVTCWGLSALSVKQVLVTAPPLKIAGWLNVVNTIKGVNARKTLRAVPGTSHVPGTFTHHHGHRCHFPL